MPDDTSVSIAYDGYHMIDKITGEIFETTEGF